MYLTLEDVLSMKSQVVGMGPRVCLSGRDCIPITVKQAAHLIWNLAFGNQNPIIVSDRDQTSVEHPVNRPGQCKTISYRIGSFLRDRHDVGGLDFGSAAAVD
jgi:hypothetical protein